MGLSGTRKHGRGKDYMKRNFNGYCSPNIIPVNKLRTPCAEYIPCMGERRGAFRDLVGKSEGKGVLGIPTRKGEDNIKIDLQEEGWNKGLDWSGSG